MWLVENVPEVAEAAEDGSLMFGTIDSYLIWRFTGDVPKARVVAQATHIQGSLICSWLCRAPPGSPAPSSVLCHALRCRLMHRPLAAQDTAPQQHMYRPSHSNATSVCSASYDHAGDRTTC